MSLAEMDRAVRGGGLAAGDVAWWPKWLERYAQRTRQEECDRIEIREESLIQLLRSLRDAGRNAFLRLQVVRAVEFYQQNVLAAKFPDLSRIRSKLEELAEQERLRPEISSATDSPPQRNDDKMLVGRIDSSEPPLLQQM